MAFKVVRGTPKTNCRSAEFLTGFPENAQDIIPLHNLLFGGSLNGDQTEITKPSLVAASAAAAPKHRDQSGRSP